MFDRRRSGKCPIRRRPRLFLEELESRTLLSASLLDTLVASPLAILNPASQASASVAPLKKPSGTGGGGSHGGGGGGGHGGGGHGGGGGSGGGTTTGPYDPAQVRTAYGFDQLFSSNYNANAGKGQTIAIIDAYNDTTLQTDLSKFDSQWGLPGLSPVSYNRTPPTSTPYIQVVGINSSGSSTTPVDPSKFASAASKGWDVETALDVEWAHAMAPAANILLIESSSGNSVADMQNAVTYAAQNASIVSMSWGQTESSIGKPNEAAFDQLFQSAATSSTNGVTFVAASGDSGAAGAPIYPAISPYVVSVGGTSLVLNSSTSTISSESGWGNGYTGSYIFGGSGGGYSAYESEPGYQSSYATSSYATSNNNTVLSNTLRGNPDVAYNADPSTGFYVFDGGSRGSWYEVGGTSAGAPQWSALIALADQGRASAQSAPLSSSGTLSALYQTASGSSYTSGFHDITSGSNGYSAGTGYDLVTGLGSPQAQNVVTNILLGAPASAAVTTASTSGSTNTTTKHLHTAVVLAGSATSASSVLDPAPADTAAIGSAIMAQPTQTSAVSNVTFGPSFLASLTFGAGQTPNALTANSTSQTSSSSAAVSGGQIYAPGPKSVSSPSAALGNSRSPFGSESADGVPMIGTDEGADPWGDGPLVPLPPFLGPGPEDINLDLTPPVPAQGRPEKIPACDACFVDEASMALVAEETLAWARGEEDGPARLRGPALALLGALAGSLWMAPGAAEEGRKRRRFLPV